MKIKGTENINRIKDFRHHPTISWMDIFEIIKGGYNGVSDNELTFLMQPSTLDPYPNLPVIAFGSATIDELNSALADIGYEIIKKQP